MDDNALTALMTRLTATFEGRNETYTATHRRICETAAPAYGEGPRAQLMATLYADAGADRVALTEVGNVVAHYPLSSESGPILGVGAHLDTVFGPEVDVTVHRHGTMLKAPGIGDDTSGLIMHLALLRALLDEQVELPGRLWFIGTVGEESVGALRGARELAARGVGGRKLDGFITLDGGAPGQIVRHGTHSRNHDLTLSGPGGHAWGEYGVVNPNFTMGEIVGKVGCFSAPTSPRTTLNCGILEGGTAGNVIPGRCHAHLNLRSESGAELAQLDAWVRQIIAESVRCANERRLSGPELDLTDNITSRQGGETPADCRLVQAAVAASRRQGWEIDCPFSSTDANAFMAEGIDAICCYRGAGGCEHTTDEWYDSATRPEALEFTADTLLRYFFTK